jgi:hypothetical protein
MVNNVGTHPQSADPILRQNPDHGLKLITAIVRSLRQWHLCIVAELVHGPPRCLFTVSILQDIEACIHGKDALNLIVV